MIKQEASETRTANSLEAFEIVRLMRSEIKPAPYNPRTISDKGKSALRRGMKRLGQLTPLIWNRRTGFLVGGHQRLGVLDKEHGWPGTDYPLQVSSVDLSDAQEREANVLLNNPEAQGDWDLERLGELLKFDGLDLDGTGFNMGDVYKVFGDSPMHNADNKERLAELSDHIKEVAERYEHLKEATGNRDGSEFYLVVVFRDEPTCDKFLTVCGLEDNRYHDGRLLLGRLLRKREADGPALDKETADWLKSELAGFDAYEIDE